MILFIYSLIFLFSSIFAYTCVRSHHALPPARDCHALIDALTVLATLPPYDEPLLWSRSSGDTATTLHLPKSYRLRTAVPNTCAIYIDVVPGEVDAEDIFSVQSVVNVMGVVVERFSVMQYEAGWAFVGGRREYSDASD